MKTEVQPIVLLVEDNVAIATSYKLILSNESILLTHLKNGNATLNYLNKRTPNVILLDLGLPDMSGMEVLKFVYEQKLKCAVIVLTVTNTVDVVVEAMRYGAFDFIEKPCQSNRLIATLRNALHQYHLSQPVECDETTGKRQQYHDFIGASEPMQMVYQMIDSVATSKASILITGETGTGKELCAEAIYKESQRAEKPFIVCNCAAIPEELRESSLFGHVKGAFTGAISEQKGLVSQADGGTLFLDEIGELPLSTQSTLLRFVQTKTFSKVGSHKLEKVDVRLICATNRNLLTGAKAGQFREDLYHRINTIEVKLPPLRERGQDILLLAKFFLNQFTKDEQKKFLGFSAEAEKRLLTYEWPGNVRQLQNTIHNVVILNGGKVITAEMITTRMDQGDYHNIATPHCIPDTDSTTKQITPSDVITIKMGSFKEIEKTVILKTIEYCEGNVTRAAQLLKISKATIFNKLKHYKNSPL